MQRHFQLVYTRARGYWLFVFFMTVAPFLLFGAMNPNGHGGWQQILAAGPWLYAAIGFNATAMQGVLARRAVETRRTEVLALAAIGLAGGGYALGTVDAGAGTAAGARVVAAGLVVTSILVGYLGNNERRSGLDQRGGQDPWIPDGIDLTDSPSRVGNRTAIRRRADREKVT